MPGSPFNDEKLSEEQKALLYAKYGLDKPVVFTGAQIPLCELRSDGRDNLTTSLMIAADGAYNGAKLEEQAASNNVTIVNTNLTGKEARDIAADFKFNEDSTRVIECPNGKTPKSCSCSKEGTCTVSFYKKDCEHCPYRDQCNPKEYSRTTRVVISTRTKQRAEKQRERKTDNFKKISAFRNGIETVPSFLRRCSNFRIVSFGSAGKVFMSRFLYVSSQNGILSILSSSPWQYLLPVFLFNQQPQ